MTPTRSLIITAHEVRAALRGELRLVVRPVKGLGDVEFTSVRLSSFNSLWGSDAWIFETPMDKDVTGYEAISRGLRFPLGVPGTVLRCREAYFIQGTHGQHRTDGLRWGSWSGLPTTISPDGTQIVYYKEGFDRSAPMWRSPATMPVWASRIALKNQGVQCVRVQELTVEDILACGFVLCLSDDLGVEKMWDAFKSKWDRRYAAKGLGWDTNPWAWKCEVRRVEP